jgi:hypothetical protein
LFQLTGFFDFFFCRATLIGRTNQPVRKLPGGRVIPRGRIRSGQIAEHDLLQTIMGCFLNTTHFAPAYLREFERQLLWAYVAIQRVIKERIK